MSVTLGTRLDTLAERLTQPDGVDEVREAVLVLQRRLAETPALGEELQHGIGAVEERLNGIEERLAAGEARVDEQLARDHSADPNQELRERLEAVERTIADLAVVEAAGASAAVEVGASRLDELASETIRSPELDALRAELASVQELVAEKLHDRQALDVEHVVDRVADLESRLARLAAATPGGELADRVSDVAQRLDSLAVATARGEDVEALRAELASVRELASASADVSGIDGLAARIEELSGRLDERVSPADLSALAGDLESRLEAGASRDELSELAGDLREQLTSLRFQVDELAAAGRSGARGEDIAALRAELASVRELAARPAGEYPVADELALRLDELGNRLEERVSLSELSAVAGDLRGELAKTSSRLEGIAVEQAASTAERLSALESRLEEAAASRRTDLATADERIAKRLDGLAADAARGEDVEALRRELQAVSDRSHQTSAEATGPEARLGELAETLAEAIRVSAEARQIASGAAAARTELDARVDALAADAAREWDVVESLRSQLEALEGVTAGERVSMHARVDALQASLAAVAERAASPDQDRVTAIAAGLEALRASLEGRATRHEVSELADSVAEQIARLDDRASRVELTALAGDLRAQLGQLAAQVAGSAAALESHREASAAALKDATEAFQAQIDARDVALSVEHSTLAAGLQEQIASGAALRASLDELHAASADRDEWRGRVEAGLASRLEGLAASLEETASQVSGLRDENDGRALEIASLQAEIAVSLDELGASLKNELALSERRAEAVDRANATSMASVMDELSRVSDRVVEVEAAATATGHSLAADLERSTGSLAWRLEQVERALADANLSASAQRFEAIEMKLDAGTAIAEEHVRVTERALRKGLATLGERIVEAEDAYAEAGNTLRRSIERLGFAIAEADVRIFERDDPVAAEQHASTAKAHVAFAPTDEGYRLVALDGPPPTIGETVTVNGKSLLCTRLGVSPLPLDPRPCAYLEPLA